MKSQSSESNSSLMNDEEVDDLLEAVNQQNTSMCESSNQYSYNRFQPTLKDIEYTISKIKRSVIDQTVDKVIDYLFNLWLHSLCTKQPYHQNSNKTATNQQKPSRFQQESDKKSIISSRRQRASSVKSVKSLSSRSNVTSQKREIGDLPKTKRDRTFTIKQKQTAAELFINKGYGQKIIKKELPKTEYSSIIPQNVYESLSILMISEVYKKMETIICEDFNKEISRLNWSQIESISSFLLYSQENWPGSKCQILHKFVKITYGFSQIIVIEEQALSIYKMVLSELQKGSDDPKYRWKDVWSVWTTRNRRILYKIDRNAHILYRSVDDHKSEAYQKEFISLYLHSGNLQQLTKDLISRYGPLSKKASKKIIRLKFQYLLRSAIEKLSQLSTQNSEKYQNLPKLSDSQLKSIYSNPYAQQVRYKLFKLHITKLINKQSISTAIDSLHMFLNLLGKEKSSQLVSNSCKYE